MNHMGDWMSGYMWTTTLVVFHVVLLMVIVIRKRSKR